jgi:hypothetical protein
MKIKVLEVRSNGEKVRGGFLNLEMELDRNLKSYFSPSEIKLSDYEVFFIRDEDDKSQITWSTIGKRVCVYINESSPSITQFRIMTAENIDKVLNVIEEINDYFSRKDYNRSKFSFPETEEF